MQSIFVSSTFRDMHYERDIIQTKVVPAVNVVAAEYGESVAAFDLRWGVNTSEMSEEGSAKKVLNVCLNEIDRCRPYMIVILGYRYGWIPDGKMLSEAIRGRDCLSLEDEQISVTALEIEYGALVDTADIQRTLFYFREIDGPCEPVYLPEDEQHRNKLEALKKRIRAIPGSHVKTYRVRYGESVNESIASFAAMVTNDICALMRPEWEQNARLDEYDLDQVKQKHYLSEKENQFVARTALLSQCMEVLRDQGKLVLQGIAGSGKSTLISKIGAQLQQVGHQVIPIYCGYTKLCSSGFDILQYIVWTLEKELGIDMHFRDVAGENIGTPSAWYEYYDLLLQRCRESGRKVTFLIDGADQLIEDDIARDFTYLPATGCDCVRFILSTTSRDKLPAGYPCVEVQRLSENERKQVVYGILNAKHRELPEAVIHTMSLPKAAALPLYLNLMIHRLLMMNVADFSAISRLGDGIDAIAQYQISLIDQCPATLSALAAYVTDHASSLVGGSMMKEAIKLLAASRRGLRLSDMEGILKPKCPNWNTLDAVSYFQYLGTLFIYRKDGRIDFAHKSIREGVLYQCSHEETLQLHGALCDWLVQLPLHDEIRMQEVVWHMIQADRKLEFARVTAQLSYNRLNISGMAKDLVDTVVSDDGYWLIEVIRECFMDDSFPTLSNMINYDLFFGLVNTPRNLQTKLQISEMMFLAVQKRGEVAQSHGNIWDITVACDRLSMVHMAFDTEEHTAKALKCSEHSLALREQLLERYRALDTLEKLRDYFMQEARAIGIQIDTPLTEYHLREMYRMLCNETRRGICVVCEDIAQVLSAEPKDQRQQILQYLQRSLELRLDMYHENDGASFVADSSEEEVEIARLHGKMARVFMSFDDEEHWNLAEQSCAQGLAMAQKALDKGETPGRLEAWCAANVQYASLYMMKKQDREKALTYYLRCVPVLERLNIQQRTVESQRNLADLYHRLGNYYEQMDDDAAAERYYQKCRALVLEIAQKCPSVENLRSVVLISQNQTHHMMNSRNRQTDGTQRQDEMEASITVAYQKAKQLFKETSTKAFCEQLNDIYDTVIRLVEESGLEQKLAQRIVIEIKACQLENTLEVRDMTMDDLRSAIVGYARLAASLEALEEVSNASVKEALIRLLGKIGIHPQEWTVPGRKRAYALMKVAYRLSERLKSKSDLLEDLDIYAVTLAKYSAMCLMFSTDEWQAINNKLLEVAYSLYRKTNREKYSQMIAIAELGKTLQKGSATQGGESGVPSGAGKQPAKTEVPSVKKAMAPSDRAGQIQKKIAALEEELKLIPGYTNILRKKKLEQQIAALKQELQDLLS